MSFELPDFKNAVVGEEIKIESPIEKQVEFAKNHHGMITASMVGHLIIEPASDAEIDDAVERIDKAVSALISKGLTWSDDEGVLTMCTYEEACAKRAKGLYEEWSDAMRALKKLMGRDFSQTAKSYLDEIVSQRRRNFNFKRPKSFSGNKNTEWGKDQEQVAIDAYEALIGLKLEKTGDKQEFVRLGYVESVDFDFSEWFGCTPDSQTISHDWFSEQGYTGWIPSKYCKKLIPREFKNPASGVVFDRYRELKTPLDLKKENALYYWQVIAQMACLDASYAQWIAYDCDIKKEYCKTLADRFVVIDFERDLAAEKVLIDSLYKAVQYIQAKLK